MTSSAVKIDFSQSDRAQCKSKPRFYHEMWTKSEGDGERDECELERSSLKVTFVETSVWEADDP